MNAGELESHRRFLNGYYRRIRHVYDLTRKYYLFGRDTALREMLESPWESLVEIGPGTGRNLRILRRRRPTARLGGLEASDEMLAHVRARCPWAEVRHGFAETGDIAGVLAGRPERILFSYCLSMTRDPEAALLNARRALAPGGEVWVVDFGDLSAVWRPLRSGLRSFLRSFHVEPLTEGRLGPHAASLRWGPGKYYVIARLSALGA